ncbi:MAG: hypothetical protein GAK29_00880 [Acinetobacter bereziniae]|uniref:DUF2635 domain-containing protein n=1 Tax=Acinetobacter bereziniae TaxID=106648 RepID=A0A833UT35_ACIBZ|nr:MAG: hypothetical protein GAK29_00880 [Acinetobacter bereziniae]
MYVIPKKGSSIPDLELQDFLPAQGREVTKSSYWIRRLQDGDVTEGKALRNQSASSNKIDQEVKA